MAAVAAGVGAFLVTRALQKYIGRRALEQEEAGVQAALAFREARAQLTLEQGKPPTRAQMAEMKDAYRAQLVTLGYDPVTFTRKRSGLSRFFTSGLGED